MELYKNLDFRFEKSAVCIGKFDGIHAGHELLIQDILKRSERSVVFTFEPESKHANIYTEDEKLDILNELGVDAVVSLPFTPELKSISSEKFVNDILIKKMGVAFVSVGEDFCYGHMRSGNAKTLKKAGEKKGFDVCIHEKLKWDERIISSTLVRNLLTEGNINVANKYLKRAFFYTGEVCHGKELGRTINFPTVNMLIPETKIIPKCGVYASLTHVRGEVHRSVTNIGIRPTVNGENINVETHILDFNEDIYGLDIKVELTEFIRPELTFASLDELKGQIQIDINKRKAL